MPPGESYRLLEKPLPLGPVSEMVGVDGDPLLVEGASTMFGPEVFDAVSEVRCRL